MDLVNAYEGARARVIELVRGLDDTGVRTRIPACPDWTAHDLLAHLVGLAGDYAAGNLPDIPPEAAADRGPEATRIVDEWTNGHVLKRRESTLDDLVREWDGHMEVLRPMIAGERDWPEGVPFWAGIGMTADITTHEHDLRAALDAPGARDSEGVDSAFQTFSTALLMRVNAAGVPALRVVAGDAEQVVGDGEPQATLKGEKFDVMRALSGRRTAEQVRAMFVEGDPEPYLPLISLYPMPESPVEG